MKQRTGEKKQAGFSMIELLVALAILSGIIAATVPSLIGNRNIYRLTTACDEIMGTVEMMRSQAIKSETVTTMTILSTGEYTAQYDQNGTPQVLRYALPPEVRFTLPTGITSITILCKPTGKVTMTGNTGASITGITVSNASEQRTINVNIIGNMTIATTTGS